MPGGLNDSEQIGGQTYSIVDGTIKDIDLLPEDLGMEDEEEVVNDLMVKFGSLEFDYEVVRKGLEKGTSRLRLIKDVSGKIIAFTVMTPGSEQHIINMGWVDPSQRKTGLGG